GADEGLHLGPRGICGLVRENTERTERCENGDAGNVGSHRNSSSPSASFDSRFRHPIHPCACSSRAFSVASRSWVRTSSVSLPLSWNSTVARVSLPVGSPSFASLFQDHV